MSTNFQNSINAGLGIAAGVSALNKKGKNTDENVVKGLQETLAAEKEKSAQDIEAAKKVPAKKYIPNKAEKEKIQKGIEANQRLAEISGDISKTREKQFLQNPSPESWNRLQQARKAQQDYERLADVDINRLQQAKERAERRKQGIAARKQSMNQIRSIPIDGGTVADLGPEAQKIVYNAFRGEKNGKQKQ